MSSTAKKIFLSYSWKNSDVANSIDQFFATYVGLPLTRDIRDMKAWSSITKFMQTVQKSDFIMILISNEYLKSMYCMYEVLEVMNTHEFENKAIPILVGKWGAVLNDQNLDEYFAYWRSKLDECNSRLQVHINEKYLEDKRKAEAINSNLGKFLAVITDLKLLSYVDLKSENFKTVIEKIEFDEMSQFDWLHKIQQIDTAEEKEILLEEILLNDPKNHYAWFQKGIIAEGLRQYKKAKLAFEKVIRIFPQDSLAYYNLGRLYALYLNDGTKAKENFLKSLSLNRDYAPAHVSLGHVSRDYFNDFGAAKKCYEDAITVNALHASAYFSLALLLNEHYSDIGGAIENYKKALIANPKYAEAHVNLGIIVDKEFGAHEKARQHYETAIKINPTLKEAQLNLALLLSQSFGEYKKTIDNLTEYLSVSQDDDPSILDTLGNCYARKRNYKQALKCYEKVITVDPNFSRTYYNLHHLYKNDLKDSKKAKWYYEEWQRRK